MESNSLQFYTSVSMFDLVIFVAPSLQAGDFMIKNRPRQSLLKKKLAVLLLHSFICLFQTKAFSASLQCENMFSTNGNFLTAQEIKHGDSWRYLSEGKFAAELRMSDLNIENPQNDVLAYFEYNQLVVDVNIFEESNSILSINMQKFLERVIQISSEIPHKIIRIKLTNFTNYLFSRDKDESLSHIYNTTNFDNSFGGGKVNLIGKELYRFEDINPEPYFIVSEIGKPKLIKIEKEDLEVDSINKLYLFLIEFNNYGILHFNYIKSFNNKVNIDKLFQQLLVYVKKRGISTLRVEATFRNRKFKKFIERVYGVKIQPLNVFAAYNIEYFEIDVEKALSYYWTSK